MEDIVRLDDELGPWRVALDFLIQASPSFSLDSADFVRLWNADPEFTRIAIARLSDHNASTEHYDGGLTLYAVLGAISLNISASAIYDLMKRLVLSKKRPEEDVEFIALDKPDGTHVITLRITKR